MNHARQFKELISNIESTIGEILPPLDSKDLCYVEDPSEEDLKNIKCIHFNNYDNNNSLKTKFNSTLTINLRKRNMLTTGSLSQKRSRLLERLKMEEELKEHKRKLEHGAMDENAFYCVEDALP